jgi:EAL domain-containing protein (putative c-di-GMP-specific phosphodiesterase class I)
MNGSFLLPRICTQVSHSIEDWNLLVRLGCDDAQGFYMSPPIDAEALVRWMRAHQQPQQRAGSYADSA